MEEKKYTHLREIKTIQTYIREWNIVPLALYNQARTKMNESSFKNLPIWILLWHSVISASLKYYYSVVNILN